MRAVEELIGDLASGGVRIWEEEGALRFSAPEGSLSPELKAEMAGRKAELLAFLREAAAATRPGPAPIRPRRPGEPTPLSFAQERLWFLDQLHPGNPAYNLPHALTLEGALDVEALERSLRTIIARHEILRSVFVPQDGVPNQVVGDPGSVELTFEDLSGGQDDPAHRREWARRQLEREARRPFDLARGPLVRTRLWRLDLGEHLLSVVLHHIVSDGWSEGVFARELAALYSAHSSSLPGPSLPELPIQFGDYAMWQREGVEDVDPVHREYWRTHLEGAPPALGLVTDGPRPSTQSFAGDRVGFHLSAATARALGEFAVKEATTPFVVFLAAWAAVLGRRGRQEDLVVGIPVANRDRRELEPLIGFLVNTLAVRVDLSGRPTGRELVRRVRRIVAEAMEHQEVPFERVVEDLGVPRDLSRPPLFQTMVAMVPPHSVPPPEGLHWRPEEVHFPFARLDLTLFVRGGGEEGFRVELEYNTELFHPPTARGISAHLERLLARLVSDPDQTVATIPLMDAEERRRLLVEWNRTQATHGSNRVAHGLMEAQAQLTPHAVAVRSGDLRLSYAELHGKAEALAGALALEGIGPGSVVGVCLRRTPDLLVALLGIWKAGGAFLPLDPSFPEERLAYMVQDAGAALVLVEEGGEGGLGRTTTVAALEAKAKARPGSGLLPVKGGGPGPEGLAYVMYTSGSSGRPKGVMIPHRGLVNYLEWGRKAYPLEKGVGAPVHTSIGFDATLTSLFLPLTAGKSVHLLPEGNELEALAGELRTPVGYSFVKLTPAHLDLLAKLVGEEIHPESTGCMIIGGEALLGRHLGTWRDRLPDTLFVNEYGPTETVVGCCTYEVAPGEGVPSGRVPIGRPLDNTRLFVLDDRGEPVPSGVPGELWVGGAGVGLGYKNRPDLTRRKFPRGALPEAEGERLYRTGDLVRHLPEGCLEYLGRMDGQINLNGFRIEPGEVESALAGHPAVTECVVSVQEGAGAGRRRLVGYVTGPGQEGHRPLEREILAWLRERLPEFMVPSALMVLDRLPLTPNGKVDRKALPVPSRAGAGAYVPPSTGVEEILTRIWKEALGVERVGVHDNFFDLGGDSILGIQVVARAAREGLALTPRLLFRHQTIAELAAATETATAGEEGAVDAGSVVPLTPIQRWFVEKGLVNPHHYNQALILETAADADPGCLEAAFAEVVGHHAAFRHRFREETDGWRQEVSTGENAPSFRVLDLSAVDPSDRGKKASREVEGLQGSLHLEEGPLVRALLVRVEGEPGRLAVVAHHLVVDSVSWRILLDDLVYCYRKLRQGKKPALPPATASFARWADGLLALAADRSCTGDLELWRRVMGSASGRLPLDHPGDEGRNAQGSVERVEMELGREETSRLLDWAPERFQATVNEFLLAALARALAGWCEGSELLIDLEGHGREPLPFLPDVSRTVGWFTALFPLCLPLDRGADPATLVARVSERVRGLPSNGATFGILRYLHPGGQTLVPPDGAVPALSWNYHGRWQGISGQGPFLGSAEDGVGPLVGPGEERSHILEVEAAVVEGHLRVEWRYSRNFHRESTIRELVECFGGALRSFLAPSVRGGESAPHPLAGLDEDQVERLSGILSRLDEGGEGGGT